MTKLTDFLSGFFLAGSENGVRARRLARVGHFVGRYGLAAVFIGAAFWIRWALTPLIGSGSPFMVLAPAALLAARFGGLGPGLAATAAGLVLGDYYFTPPEHSWGPYDAPEITLILTYGIATVVGVLLFHQVQKSRAQVQDAARRAELAARQAEMRGNELEREVRQREKAEQEVRRARDELSRHATELEERVRERTVHVHQALSSLESVLYHIAHDLRAPLRAMDAFASILVENYGEKLDATGQDYARRISDAALRMDHMLRDLLEYGHVCHLEVIGTPVKLEQAVAAALSKFHGRIEAAQGQVEVLSPLPEAYADTRLLQTVVTQIVSNALKFVPQNRTPRLRIWHEEHASKEGMVRICFEDNGIGIAPEHHERIFRIFERLRQHKADPSTGIGLAMAEKAIDRMHGFIGVSSTPGKGSIFWIELPTRPDHNNTDGTETKDPKNFNHNRLL